MIKAHSIFSILAFLAISSNLCAQVTHNYNFTNASHNLNHTAYVSPIDVIQLTNNGVPDVYHILFSLSGTFQDDELQDKNVQVSLNNGSAHSFDVAYIADEIEGNEFFVRVQRTNGIQLLTVKVLFGYVNIHEDNVELSFHPNPSSDYVLIPAYVNELLLFDSSGKLLIQREVRSTNYLLDIRHLQRGRYFLLIDGIVHGLLVE
jgi:hypothetical protein